eukprot:scaffold27052_cov169-Skeletonema_menzelii.AAC.10
MKGLLLLVILVAGLSADPVAGSFFGDIWEEEQDFFDKINEKIEESNKPDPLTNQPTLIPSTHPSLSPTISNGPSSRPSSSPSDSSKPSYQPSAKPSSQPSSMPSSQPTSVPSHQPSMNPTLSTSPTSQPSSYPTLSSSPSNEPSLDPTISTSPSSQPSEQPTLSSSPSAKPSSAPSTSLMPTDSPSSKPSSIPSKYPSTGPSLFPTTIQSLSPSDEPSLIPSTVPSETNPIITRIIIKSDSSRRNLVAVGAVSLLLMASVVTYVLKNVKRLKGGDRNANDEVPSLQHSSSMSQSSNESEQHGHDAAKLSVNFAGQINNHDGADLVEIDLEDGQHNKQTEDSVAESSIDLNSLPGGVKEKTVSTISKIFKRRPIGAEKPAMTWMDIRDDGSPACSSGCEPAKGGNSITSLSPLKNISSARMRLQSLISISSEETDDLPSVDGGVDGDDKLEKSVVSPTKIRENDGARVQKRFNVSTTNIERQQCSHAPSVANEIIQKRNISDNDCVTSPDSIFSGLGDLSPDGSRMNMDQLKNILGTVKTLGSFEESFISTSSTGTSVTDFKKKAKARLGLYQGQAKGHQNAHSESQDKLASRHGVSVPSVGITFEKELLGATSSSCDGFNFEQIYTDPRNEICECHMPSGPLGIIVEATQVGMRVRKINSMSPLCHKISVGDIIIAVDEVDVVGMESCVFWQLVSRRANKQQRCLVVLRI